MTNLKNLKKLFNNSELLTLALTHKSWINEHSNQRRSNERLEFLGDAVLEFVISNELYKKFPDKEEGYLTALRANLVNTKNLANVAKRLELGKAIYLSKGEEESGGRDNSSLLADTLEAVIGALFIDSGISVIEKFIKTNILVDLSEKVAQPLKDAKSRFQELIQAKGLAAPNYIVTKEDGPDHDKSFTVEVKVNKKVYAKGEGKSKSEAEQDAAEKALLKLK